MNQKDCVAAGSAAAGRPLTDDEAIALTTALQQRQRYLAAQNLAATPREIALQAAQSVASDLKAAAFIEKRNAAMNLITRADRALWVQTHFGKNVAEGLEAILSGVNRAKPGARVSVDSVQKLLARQYEGGLMTDLHAAGVHGIFASGSLDRDVFNALYAMQRMKPDTAALAKLPPEAVTIAKIVDKWQEVARLNANEAGASIGKYEGYVARRSWDMAKIASAGFDQFKADAAKWFDLPRMQGASEATSADGMLRGIYDDLASGNHMRDLPRGETSPFKGPANIAKRLSQSRTIHFVSGDAAFEANAAYGAKNLREAIVGGLHSEARATGLMRMLGTNPGAMFDAVRNDLIQSLKSAPDGGAQITRLREQEAHLANIMAVVDGTANIPVHAIMAKRSANIRAFETITKLGFSLFSQLNDIAINGANTRYQGRGFFTGMAETVRGLGVSLKDADRRDLAHALGVTIDDMVGSLARIGSNSEPGSLNTTVRRFMKFNGMDWWTSRLKNSAVTGMSAHMALQADKPWAALSDEYRRVFSLYDIGAKEWDAIRASPQRDVHGNSFIVPEAVTDKKTADKLALYFMDQTSYAATEADARTRALLFQGTRPGTWSGEFARFIGQFKLFTASYMQKVLGRELYGRGYEGDSIMGALRHGEGEFTGLAELILASTLLGYGSMALKDVVKGRTPRDPTESPAQAAKVFFAAMVQGGGAGIYGDFLFGSASRSGGGTVETLAGPALSEGARIVDLYHKAMAGEDVKASALREAMNNTPFLNSLWTRAALDYMLIYRLQESMNPGYLRRMEHQVEKQNGQTFLLRPSEVVR